MLSPASLQRSLRRRQFAVAWLTYAFYYLGRVNLPVALPALQAEFGWSPAAVGLIGTAMYWTYAAGQLVNGHLGDRLSPRRLVALGLLGSAALNLLFGSLGALGGMVLVWALNGWVQSTGWGPIVKTLSHWFRPEERGRVTAAFAPCSMAGHALSWALAGWLVASAGWRSAFQVPGLLLVGVAAAWYLLARDAPPWAPAPGPAASGAPQRGETGARLRALAGLLSGGGLRWAVVGCLLSGMVKDALTLWTPTYLASHGLAVAVAVLGSLVVPVMGVAGGALAGVLVGGSRARGEAGVVAGLALLAAAMAGGLWTFGDALPAVRMLCLGGLALACYGINALLMTSLPLALGPGGQVSGVAGALDLVSYVGGGLSVALSGGLQARWGWPGVFASWVALAAALALLAWGRAAGGASRRVAPMADPSGE